MKRGHRVVKYPARSQAAAFQKLAIEPRVLGTLVAGGALSLSVVYAQAPVGRLLDRPSTAFASFAGPGASPATAWGKAHHPLLIEPLIRLKPWGDAEEERPSEGREPPSSLAPVSMSDASGPTQWDRAPLPTAQMTSTVAMQPLLASALPSTVHEVQEPPLAPAVAAAPTGAAPPAGTFAVPEAALVATMAPGSLSGPDHLATAAPNQAGEAIDKSPDAQPGQPTARLTATAAPGEQGVAGLSVMEPEAVAIPPSEVASTGLAMARAAIPAIAQPAAVPVPQAGDEVIAPRPAPQPANAATTSLSGMTKVAGVFDLGALKLPARAVKPKASLVAARPSALASSARPGSAHGHSAGAGRVRDRVEGDVIFHQAKVNLDDHSASALSVRIGAGGDLSLRVGDLLSLYEPGMAPAVFSRLAGSSAANEFVSFDMLRSAGIDIRYDAGQDQLRISARD